MAATMQLVLLTIVLLSYVETGVGQCDGKLFSIGKCLVINYKSLVQCKQYVKQC